MSSGRKRGIRIDDGELRGILRNPRLNSRGQYICDCPFCGKEAHFYISRETQLWDCKRCGQSGNVYKLLRKLDKLYLLGGRTIEDRGEEGLKSLREMSREMAVGEEEEGRRAGEEILPPVVKMPVGWRRLEKPTDYLRGRGVTEEEVRRYEIGMSGLKRRWENYLIIPIRGEGEVRGWIGRWNGRKVPEGKLRYNNSAGTNFGKLLWGYDEIERGKTRVVILVEGVFDKMAVDRGLRLGEGEEIKCVATFGKKISRDQIFLLLGKEVERVVLLYDADAVREMKRYGEELNRWFDTTITFSSHAKDIDECNPSEFRETFARLWRPDDFREGVLSKIVRK